MREFEEVQAGLEVKKQTARSEEPVDRAAPRPQGHKRKFELDEDELLRIAQHDRGKARQALDAEKVGKSVYLLWGLLTRA